MPLLLEKDGYQFYFKKGEPLIPYKQPHVHVRGHGGSIQFFLTGEIKKDNKSLGNNRITEISSILIKNKENFLTIWNKIKLEKEN